MRRPRPSVLHVELLKRVTRFTCEPSERNDKESWDCLVIEQWPDVDGPRAAPFRIRRSLQRTSE